MMTLLQLKRDTVENGMVTDAQYDWSGKRLATTSTDATITIRDLDDRGGWVVKDGGEIKAAHAGVIWRVSWAHPQFGQILATCCQDGTVKIWEEVEGHLRNGKRWPTRWYAQQTITIDKVVSDVKFAPRHHGLKIATALGDGSIRMYVSTGHNQWTAQEVFGEREGSIACLSWMPSRFELPMMAVGTSTGRIQIWGNRPTAKSWERVLELPGHESQPVTDIDWATCTGRKHHRVASCGLDGRLQVHLLMKDPTEEGESRGWKSEAYELHDDAEGNEEWRDGAAAGELSFSRRVAWDAMGAVLNSRSEDGTLRMWARDADGAWVCVDSLRVNKYDRRTDLTEDASSGNG